MYIRVAYDGLFTHDTFRLGHDLLQMNIKY